VREHPDPELRAGARRFDAGEWFAAHEAWEEAWRRAEGARRALLQGLILAAAALWKRERGVPRGAARLWARGRAKLREGAPAALLPEGAGGLDVERFVAALDAALAGAAPPPRIAEHLLPGARREEAAASEEARAGPAPAPAAPPARGAP